MFGYRGINNKHPKVVVFISYKYFEWISGSDGHTLALSRDGHVYTWGDGKKQRERERERERERVRGRDRKREKVEKKGNSG